MPYEIKQNVADCSGYAVVKRGTENVVGCHETAADAQKQMAALYAAEPEMFAKSLSDAGLINVHNKLHGEELNSVTATLHHTLAEEMKSRNIDHENVDCPLHKMVVLKSELVLSKEKADAIVKGQPTSGDVHLDTIMGGRKKKKRKLILEDEEIAKGDKPGHPFRGNQHSGKGGGAGGGAGGTTETDAQQMADEQDREQEKREYELEEKIAELEDKFSEKQSQAEDEMRQIEDKVKIGIEDYREEHKDEDGQLLESYDSYNVALARDVQNEMREYREIATQEIDFGDGKTVAQRQVQIDQLSTDWDTTSDRLLNKLEEQDSEDLDFSAELDDFGNWMREVINTADFTNKRMGELSGGVGKSASMVVVQELLTVDGTVFALRKMHGGDMSMYGETPEMEEEYDSQMEMENYLTPRQKMQYEAFEWIAEKFGPWDKGNGANGAHYMEASANPFKKEGMICSNCVFYCGGRKCEIVSGDIDPNALCKLWIIEDTNLTVSKELSTEEQQDSVIKAIKEGDFVSWDNVGGVARGRVTHVMQEGTLGVPESSFKIKAEPNDPAVLIQLYRKNSDGKYVEQKQLVGHKMSELRQIKSLEKADKFTPPASVQAAGKRAVEWIKEGLNGDGFTSVGRLRARQLANGEGVTEDTVRRMANYFTRHEKDQQAEGFSQGEKGYPRPGRVAWDAWGGDAGKTWSQNLVERLNKKEVLKSVDEKRFTLAPWYVPNSLDAHLEWTDPEELQKALWTYVKSGNHDIRLQHVPDTVAGQWVEAMTWPFEVEVPMMNLENGTVQKKTFPENTVFLGVQWEPWAWELVKKGQIRGFSIGGKAGRKEEDLYVVLDKSSGETVVKGDKPGHPFRGNQHSRGGGGAGLREPRKRGKDIDDLSIADQEEYAQRMSAVRTSEERRAVVEDFKQRLNGESSGDKSGIKTSRASSEMLDKIQTNVGEDRKVKSVQEVKVDGKLVGHVSREQHFTTTDFGAKQSDGHRYHARDAQGKSLGAYRSNYRDGGYVQEQRTFGTSNEAVMAVATGNTP